MGVTISCHEHLLFFLVFATISNAYDTKGRYISYANEYFQYGTDTNERVAFIEKLPASITNYKIEEIEFLKAAPLEIYIPPWPVYYVGEYVEGCPTGQVIQSIDLIKVTLTFTHKGYSNSIKNGSKSSFFEERIIYFKADVLSDSPFAHFFQPH